MTASLNIVANMILGCTAAYGLRNNPSVQRESLSWPLFTLLLFEALVVTPIAAFLFRFFPQWSMMYVFDPQLHPDIEKYTLAFTLAAVALNFAGLLLGFLLTRNLVINRSKSMALIPIVMSWLGFIALAGLYYPRIAYVGGYDIFWQNQADLVFMRAPGIMSAVLYLVSTGFLFFLISRYRNEEPKLLA